ncbi:MAG TPA: hypothetical protein VMW10_00645, partial [Alphaproteobacteria bacterium]|nr:hypothetical protein [Alphaproteobacteria bacterium]
SAPSTLKGLLEVRGIGLCPFPYQEKSPLVLCVEICEGQEPERLPEIAIIEFLGVKVPYLKLTKNDPLGAIKVELKVRANETQREIKTCLQSPL